MRVKHKEQGKRRVNAKPSYSAGAHSTAKTSKSTGPHRGKGNLGAKLHGKKHADFGPMAYEKFGIHAKKPENDNLGRKIRPAAHNPRQAKVAKRASKAVRRLGDGLI